MINFIEFKTELTPVQMYSKIRKEFSFTFLLESMEGPEKFTTQSVLGFEPLKVFEVNDGKLFINNNQICEGLDAIKKEFQSEIEKFQVKTDISNQFMGGLVGFTSYDIIRYKEDLPRERNDKDYPDALYGLYLDGIRYDHMNDSLVYFYHNKAQNRISKLKKILEHDQEINKTLKVSDPEYLFTQNEFEEGVKTVIEGIKKGETFQTVISQRINFTIEGDQIQIYKKLRDINPSPYMYYLEFNEYSIIGSSPELLVSTLGDKITTYPIAGTRPLASTKEENEEVELDLLNDEKEIAEHNMLVDLARNDIGIISEFNTVNVEEYKAIEYFSHVMHIVSKVTGKIRKDLSMFDAFFATFPAGTVSGAPKVRSMEVIDQIEPVMRGPYAGSVGYFGINNESVQAITIRTAFGKGNNFSIQAGAGIVLDSDPRKEYEETLHKLGALFQVLQSD